MDKVAQLYYDLSTIATVRVALIMAASIAGAYIARALFSKVILSLSARTKTDVDDKIARIIRQPVFNTLIIIGAAWAIVDIGFREKIDFFMLGILKTMAVIIWGGTAMKVGDVLLDAMSRQADKNQWIQEKTLPLFEIIVKVVVIGGSLYFAFISWNINVTSWLASAGIVGIAVGFAAKDTLANLFSGVFILADTPYKLGDFIILDNQLRGMVTDIGIRSTRILTRDDIEVTLPNAIIANSKIINETGGPHRKMRIRVKVSVAYGSDVDRVEELLLQCANDIPRVVDDPTPRVRFREFGDSGLLFELLCWIEEPVFRGNTVHELSKKVYKTFMAEGIEIPYAKHDIYIKEQPKD